MESGSSKNDNSYPYEYINTEMEDSEDFKFKVSAISACDNILALGTDNGYLYSYEIRDGPHGYTFEKNSDGSKRGNEKIVKLQIIPAQYNITLLVDKNFFMVSMEDLSTKQTFQTKDLKDKVYNFAIKSKVDIYEVIDPFDISLALANQKGFIYIWKFNNDFKFEEEKNSSGEVTKFNVGEKIYGMEWVENTIYVGKYFCNLSLTQSIFIPILKVKILSSFLQILN